MKTLTVGELAALNEVFDTAVGALAQAAVDNSWAPSVVSGKTRELRVLENKVRTAFNLPKRSIES